MSVSDRSFVAFWALMILFHQYEGWPAAIVMLLALGNLVATIAFNVRHNRNQPTEPGEQE